VMITAGKVEGRIKALFTYQSGRLQGAPRAETCPVVKARKNGVVRVSQTVDEVRPGLRGGAELFHSRKITGVMKCQQIVFRRKGWIRDRDTWQIDKPVGVHQLVGEAKPLHLERVLFTIGKPVEFVGVYECGAS